MEFRFNLQPLFINNIVRVNYNLVPKGYVGDRRSLLDATSKISEIIDNVGEASAKAQGLHKAVTTAHKLRQTETQHIYLLADLNQGKNGAVLGLLKVGTKSLYVFDLNGQTKMVDAPCVLDFYIHESRQRSGLGKELFDAMLKQENWSPEKIAIDRPSSKLLGFLSKHYGLERTIPQMNNFVVYEGFFDSPVSGVSNGQNGQVHITTSPNTALFGPQFTDEQRKRIATKSHQQQQQKTANSLPIIQNSPVGRYAAARPMCSMAEIIHTSATPATGEPNSNQVNKAESEAAIQKAIEEELEKELASININAEVSSKHDDGDNNSYQHQQGYHHDDVDNNGDIKHSEEVREPIHISKPTHFQLSKQHTGLKNISYNVGQAVSPTNKMEFGRQRPESFGHAKLGRPTDKFPAGLPAIHDTATCGAASPVSSTGSGGDGYTDQGYFDLKFHHSRLW